MPTRDLKSMFIRLFFFVNDENKLERSFLDFANQVSVSDICREGSWIDDFVANLHRPNFNPNGTVTVNIFTAVINYLQL